VSICQGFRVIIGIAKNKKEVCKMKYLYERVSYLRGLADGLQVSEDTKEGKLLVHIVDVLEDFADAVNELAEAHDELDEYVECIDEDLAEVEEEVLGDFYDEDYDDYDDDEEFIEVECPHCEHTVLVEEEVMEDDDADIICPNCHEPIYVDFDEIDDDEDEEEGES
jgi:DNA-directed RNA polymerase subunit delta